MMCKYTKQKYKYEVHKKQQQQNYINLNPHDLASYMNDYRGVVSTGYYPVSLSIVTCQYQLFHSRANTNK